MGTVDNLHGSRCALVVFVEVVVVAAAAAAAVKEEANK